MNPRRQNLKNVTHEEIENAMKRYLDNGGTIKHLDSPYDNPNLNYDSMDHEERQMVYRPSAFPHGPSNRSSGWGYHMGYQGV